MSRETETITITGLQPGTTAALEELARQEGKDTDDLLRRWLQVELLSRKPFREILAPVRASFKASGMTADELDALVKEEREVIWEEKQNGTNG
ncbi:MAG: hypothetical protein JMDDDDMK_05028 [Acidobacteria bacterium]|nr:hypothetical protein [Acidobacteriota bacterium]